MSGYLESQNPWLFRGLDGVRTLMLYQATACLGLAQDSEFKQIVTRITESHDTQERNVSQDFNDMLDYCKEGFDGELRGIPVESHLSECNMIEFPVAKKYSTAVSNYSRTWRIDQRLVTQ